MDRALKYTFLGIGAVGALVIDALAVASLTYFLTRNHYRSHNPGQAQARTVQTATLDSLRRYGSDLAIKLGYLEDENAALSVRLMATQESLAASRGRRGSNATAVPRPSDSDKRYVPGTPW